MVTLLVPLKVPPVNVPPIVSMELAPGVELVKLSVVLKVAPGARVPTDWGSGDPFVAPSLPVVSITLLAVTAPVFWRVTLATTVVEFMRVNVALLTMLTVPQGTVQK